jgi:hypothetical protein
MMATLMKVLFVGTMKECMDLECKLRPRPRIGWNIVTGGAACYVANWWTNADSISCTLYWVYDSILHTNPECEGYIGVTSQTLKDRLAGHKRRWPDLAINPDEV